MMGGIIIDIAHRGDKVLLWCAERLYDAAGDRAGIGGECGVFINGSGEVPAVGDDVWWHCGTVYWAPADRRFIDRKLRKIGYSSSGLDMLHGEGESPDRRQLA